VPINWSHPFEHRLCRRTKIASHRRPAAETRAFHSTVNYALSRNYVSTSEAEQDSDDVDTLYLLIQRQFEDPDDDWCYIETHDKNYIGHFHLRRVEYTYTPHNLSIEFDLRRVLPLVAS
jgi:hypothetical protein